MFKLIRIAVNQFNRLETRCSPSVKWNSTTNRQNKSKEVEKSLPKKRKISFSNVQIKLASEILGVEIDYLLQKQQLGPENVIQLIQPPNELYKDVYERLKAILRTHSYPHGLSSDSNKTTYVDTLLFTIVDHVNRELVMNPKILLVKEYDVRIYPTYYPDKLHTEWPFNTSKNYDELNVYRWKEPQSFQRSQSNGHGENGKGVAPPADEIQFMDKLFYEHNFNLLASEMISLHRSLPDARSNECKGLSYPRKLPTTSVIVIFHNESWTTLLRTVWSIINRSPRELIKEIVLVDDFSTWLFLKRPLEDYVQLLPVLVKVIRTSNREGLIRARLIGAKYAKGNVLTFLDAHVECNEGWLQPLLSRIANDRSVIAIPLIDTISSADMSYQYGDTITISGFRWTLIYNWIPIPERELIRTHYDITAAIQTPTMIGCVFSIDHEFFFELGSFDDGMNIWGSENMELSLRVWQCGGSMNIIPCSRVGHLFRVSTYSFDGDKEEIKAKNNMRLVEVWMNDLKYLYYAANPPNKNLQAGDLTERQDIKRRLKCKSFRWYLENVYPESNMRKEFIYLGEIKSSSKMCLDINVGDIGSPLIMSTCRNQGRNQFFALTNDQMIVTSQEFCVGTNNQQYAVVSVNCGDQSQSWKFHSENKWLLHIFSGLCMMANQAEVILVTCDPDNINLVWDINPKL